MGRRDAGRAAVKAVCVLLCVQTLPLRVRGVMIDHDFHIKNQTGNMPFYFNQPGHAGQVRCKSFIKYKE